MTSTLLPNGANSATGALCTSGQYEPDWWFADGARAIHHTLAAKRICQACPIQQACLNGALARGEEHGVWGGLDPQQRRRLLAKGAQSTSDVQVRRARVEALAADDVKVVTIAKKLRISQRTVRDDLRWLEENTQPEPVKDAA